MRRGITPVLVFIFIFISVIPLSAFAFQTSYSKDLKIGLKSMESISIDIILNGNYRVNSILVSSGTSFTVKVSTDKLRINGTEYTEAEFTPENKANTLSISNGAKRNWYQGSFIFKASAGKVLPINIINVEDYLKGVVGYEMSDYFPIEALKAQAVASRNYALLKTGSFLSLGYDFDDTEAYQVYGGYNESYKRIISAVDQTRGVVLLYDGKLAETLYSASHGGHTESSVNVWGNPVPYLKSKADPFENESWPLGNRLFTGQQIESALKNKRHLALTDKFIKIDLNSISRYPSSRVSSINVVYMDLFGAERAKSFTRDLARTFLALPSSMYYVSFDDASSIYTFSGKGYGHGLGMSQIGARNRAAAGQSYEDILKFYYEGSYLYNLISGTSQAYDELNSQSYNTYIRPRITNVAASGTFYEKRQISVKPEAADTGTSPLTYRFELSRDGKVIETKDLPASTGYMFTPGAPGTYKISAYIKSTAYQGSLSPAEVIYVNVLPEPIKISKLTSKRGMEGSSIAKIQMALKSLGYNTGAIDGVFGNKTFAQLVRFQKAKGIKATGIVDSTTLKALNDSLIQRSGTKVLTSLNKPASTNTESVNIPE